MNGIGLPLQNIALNKPRLLPPPVQLGLAKHRTQPRFPKLTLSPANPSGWHQRHWPALAQKLAASRAIVCGRARLRPLVACRLGFWLGCSRPLADTSTHRADLLRIQVLGCLTIFCSIWCHFSKPGQCQFKDVLIFLPKNLSQTCQTQKKNSEV